MSTEPNQILAALQQAQADVAEGLRLIPPPNLGLSNARLWSEFCGVMRRGAGKSIHSDCWLWFRALGGNYLPVATFGGKTRLVQNFIAAALKHDPPRVSLPRYLGAVTTCENAFCVNPAHIEADTRKHYDEWRIRMLPRKQAAKRTDLLPRAREVPTEASEKFEKGSKQWKHARAWELMQQNLPTGEIAAHVDLSPGRISQLRKAWRLGRSPKRSYSLKK